MNVNYVPTVLIDTKDLTKDEWINYRKKGIGGSDAAAVFGQSPFKTTRDLYYEKLGASPETSKSNWIQLAYGTALEELVAEIFSKQTGFKIERDTNMYVHPEHDFMLANIDFITYNHKGDKCLLECKTTTYYNKDIWSDGVPLYYELQCRHYMAVMNIDICYIACLWDNNESSFIYHKLERDLDIEKELIKKEQFFWYDYVWSEVEPSLTENSKLALNTVKMFIPKESVQTNAIIPNYLKTNIKDYISTREKRLSLSKQLKDYEEREKLLYIPILEELKGADTGFFSDGENSYYISNKQSQRTTINKDSLKKLKLKYPNVYDEFVTTTSGSSFSINVKNNSET